MDPHACRYAASLPPEGAQFSPLDGPAARMDDPSGAPRIPRTILPSGSKPLGRPGGRLMMLSIAHLNQYYGGSHILRNVGFDVPDGKCTALLGRNGVGKTTLRSEERRVGKEGRSRRGGEQE